MRRIVVLGGCGGIGAVAARTVVTAGHVDEVVVADLRAEEAAAVAEHLSGRSATTVTSLGVDVTDPAAVARAVQGATVVINCVGPFYRFGPPVLEAVIDAGVPYVDVCDDLDATVRMLELDGAARARGVCAVIGMGNSPGLANVLTRYCADHLLDRVDSVDIMHIHGGEADEGGAVIKHRIHAMTNDVPVFEDGELRNVRLLEPSAAPYVVDVDFRDVGIFPVYPYPHPETVTLPRHLPGVRRVTNRGVVFPLSYFELTMDLVRAGLCSDRVLQVGDAEVVSLEVAVAHLLAERPRLLAEAGVRGPAGCLRIDIAGERDGEPHRFVFSLSSRTEGAAEGTGIPAGLAALLLARGDVVAPGVHPPEAVVDPLLLLSLATELIAQLGVIGGGGSVPITIVHHHPDGSAHEIDLGL
ncbi:MAG: SDR family NAD(P)-dependent oxidoreductase [Acidimicrobiales bacterium]|jgi:saccharopine dehydrogenase (NAD+, L-lysine-forming)|nr:SDR family NAD(P)-dependent oxidoreductase [Acidimicrobiales bacterium]